MNRQKELNKDNYMLSLTTLTEMDMLQGIQDLYRIEEETKIIEQEKDKDKTSPHINRGRQNERSE